MALPRQRTDSKFHPTNWIALGQLQTHIHQRWVLLVVVYKSAVYPAEHEAWPKIFDEAFKLGQQNTLLPIPCTEMDLMSLCLVEMKGTKNPPHSHP